MIIIDTETGGLSPRENAILSIGAVLYESGECWGTRIIPNPRLKVDPRAAEINGYTTPEEWGGVPEAEAALGLIEFTDGRDEIVAGANVGFDIDFIQAWITRTGFRTPFWPRKVDVQGLALNAHNLGKLRLPRKPNGQLSFSVDAICQALGVDREGSHDALQDAKDTATCIRLINALT
jgi:DNA polymerase III epsilon subunit-like protein